MWSTWGAVSHHGPLDRFDLRGESGKYKHVRLFVLTLGCSRKSVRLLALKSSSRVWAELHERAFRQLGGVPRVIVLDNLREGVITPDIYAPALNPLYRDVLAHYGAVALSRARPRLQRQGRVRSGPRAAHAPGRRWTRSTI